MSHPSQPVSSDANHCNVSRAVGVEQLAQSITGWEQVYDQMSCGRFHGELTELLLGPAQFFMETSSHALLQSCKTWSDAVWFGIPARDGRPGRIEGAPIGRGMLAVRTGHADFQLMTPDDFVFLGVVVKLDELNRHLARQGHKRGCETLFDQRVLSVPDAALDNFRQWLCRMLQVGTALTPAQLTPQVRASILDETLEGLAQLLLQREPARRETVTIEHSRRVMRRTRDYLMAHDDQCVTVQQLCDELGISRRALQDCFHRVLDLAPKTYLRAVGLNAARRELRRRDSTCATVSDVATRFGFWHLSQFAADYRRLFSELPSQTLRERSAEIR